MIALIIVQAATKLARFGKAIGETWTETRRLRLSLGGPAEE